jgi:hypothetical protein
VPQAAGQDQQLGAQRGRPPAGGVEAPRRLPPGMLGAAQRREPGVVARAAVVDRGVGQVPDARARPGLQLLLVAPLTSVSSKGPAASSSARRTPMFTPQATGLSVSRGPRSCDVIGGRSRPQVRRGWSSKRARIGPVRKPTSASAAAAPASIAASHPGATATSSSRNSSHAGPVPAAATPALRAPLIPRPGRGPST